MTLIVKKNKILDDANDNDDDDVSDYCDGVCINED